jgi:hypothetical protein
VPDAQGMKEWYRKPENALEFILWSLIGFFVALLLTLGLKALELSVHWRAVMAGAYALAIAAVAFSIIVFTGWTTRGGWLLGCALGWLFGGLWVDDLLWRIRHGRSETDT